MSGVNNVLFIGHEASRTGAPIVLLRFMEWFRKHTGCKFSCLLIVGGEIEDDFYALCPTYNLQSPRSKKSSLWKRALKKTKLVVTGRHLSAQAALQKSARAALQNQVSQPDLIYCNTLSALAIFEKIPQLTGRVICHVHELEFAIRVVTDVQTVQASLNRVDRFIACSQAVADNLVNRHSIPADRIDVVHEFIPEIKLDQADISEKRRWLRDELGIAPDTLVVGGSGQFGWRKGTDLFVQLAKLTKKMQPQLNVHFLWLGGALQTVNGNEFIRDIELCELEDYVTVIPSKPNPLSYFAGLDLFVLTSREDPYPLVCLEAAACRVPLVCFERSGGMPEFIEDDSGAIVAYLDVQALAAKIIDLLQDTERRQRFGRTAQQKVRARHELNVACAEILSAMQRTVGNPPLAESKQAH